MSPAVDVSWHPNHFLSDYEPSALCSLIVEGLMMVLKNTLIGSLL